MGLPRQEDCEEQADIGCSNAGRRGGEHLRCGGAKEDSGRRVVLFSHIITEIDTIVEVLDSVVDATKAKETLKLQLSGFKDQIVALESEVTGDLKKGKKKQGNAAAGLVKARRGPAATVNFADLQYNIDVVAQSLGIEPVWKSKKGLEQGDEAVVKATKCGIGFARLKQMLQKMVWFSSLRTTTLSAFSLR
jgi:hypothetical protein